MGVSLARRTRRLLGRMARAEMQEKGWANVRRFSWDNSTAVYREIFRTLAG